MNIKLFVIIFLFFIATNASAQPMMLKPATFRHYIDSFNRNDEELYPGAISNAESWNFLQHNIPLLDCPDKVIEQTYYFRWWTYRKHISKTATGYIITEFLPPVPWAGKYNGISCPAGFHFAEGRWLHTRTYLDDYAKYWFNGEGSPRTYSFWSAKAIYEYCMVTNNFSLALNLFPDLVKNYQAWEQDNLDSIGLFRQEDGKDGMEVSVCGANNPVGYRSTINAYMYGDALALAEIARKAGDSINAGIFRSKASVIKQHVQQKLWDEAANFYKVLPVGSAVLCNARELHGYTPWFTNMPDESNSIAWKFLLDSNYFYAPFGLTTVERSHPGFKIDYAGHECQWNGPSWPYATSVTLTAMANLLNGYRQSYVDNADYLKLLHQYAQSHQRLREDGKVVPWIDENLNPLTGDWISRTRLKSWANGTWSEEKGGRERGKDYNHSSFCDLVISGLIGLRPQEGNRLVINPLLPAGAWDYFCLDNVMYHGRILTIIYDRNGKRYHRRKGLSIYANGKLVSSSSSLRKLIVELR